MRALPILLLAVASVGLAQKAEPPQPVKLAIPDLLKARDKHHEKPVAVTGKVADFEARTSRRGNKYTVFKLSENKQTVNVWLRGHLEPKAAPKDGDRATVTGIYRKEKKVGQMTFSNEVDASAKKGQPYGVKVLDGS